MSAGTSAGTRPSAVVFAYSNVGVRCLHVLLDADVDVRLVVTHTDNPTERIWFDSVAELAAERGLPVITPGDPNDEAVLRQVQGARADFLFSFYYRHMLGAPLLATPTRGAFNMHGSLLPRFRGRAPVNWAVLHGARETGATLHVMDVKPDFGPIVDQCAVPILIDDNARQVFEKVTVAAEIVLARALPALIDGSARFTPQQHLAGHYFGARRPEDGRIPADASAKRIHDLVRAVVPPEYPGAFFDALGHRIGIARTFAPSPVAGTSPSTRAAFVLKPDGEHLSIEAADGHRLQVLRATLDGEPCDAALVSRLFGAAGATPDPIPNLTPERRTL